MSSPHCPRSWRWAATMVRSAEKWAGGGADLLTHAVSAWPGVSPRGSRLTVRSSLHMSAISLLAGLLLGIGIGAAIGYLFARSRLDAEIGRASCRERV